MRQPDALIGYPGSIEKLKLLGATYLPIWAINGSIIGSILVVEG
jgi:hypothetical protein